MVIEGDERGDEIIAGVIMEVIAIVGIIVSLATVSLIYRSPLFHNAFGIICASHLLADVGLLSMSLFWAGPASLLGFPESLTQSYAGKRIGQFSMLFWYASIYGQLQLAINRLIAITSPMLYNSIFSLRRTRQILIFFWALSFIHIIAYFWDGCDFEFDVSSMLWNYSTSPCGEIISFYLDFIHGTTLCVVVIIMHTATFTAICKQVQKLSGSTTRKQDMNMLRKNVRLYIQACLQSGCFALMIFSFHILSRLVRTKWATFFLTTFVWEAAHALDGIIIFMFYENFRKVFCNPSLLWRKNVKGSNTAHGTMFVTSRRFISVVC